MVSKSFAKQDVFVFSFYTSLAYIDVFNLKRSEINLGIDKQRWIFAQRQKTSRKFLE
jgi:hypothetical protein